MTRFGYTLMTEQSGPKELVRYAQAAEDVGFEFATISDHYSPWLASQGHSPYAWSVLGAVAAVTRRMDLMTYVTCPTMRYHPAVVAQKAATVQILSDGRFTLGLGSGENLNEHVIGAGWPSVAERQERLREAVQLIRELHTGNTVTRHGRWYRADAARLWDLPETPVPIAVAVSGSRSVDRFAPLADEMVLTAPESELIEQWHRTRSLVLGDSTRSRVTCQVPVSWDTHRDSAIHRAHDQFRWFAGGWAVNSTVTTPSGFSDASQFVRPEDVADSIPCGPDLDEMVAAVRPFLEAGCTDVTIVQIGDERQEEFLAKAAGPLLEKLRAAASV
ncbi:TIGR03557 family F420-dependent LLM class oxidoreductase [Nocardia wallacei]|uniref:TIGR03557 family F420-dependent LLM class oxidoreductase n=1 Tax=Nocardia wallacei TaxID=480035 RepID=UPI002457FA86|nr:TIGR03557 family F420-dependent LLM class oxidoreductase [Nocardia wallacei]